MIRALTILAAVAALAVSASPASAGSSKKPPQSGASGFTKVIDHEGRFLGFKDGTSNTLMVGRGGSNGILTALMEQS